MEFRCRKCGKLLFIGWFIGKIEIKCHKCKEKITLVNKFDWD